MIAKPLSGLDQGLEIDDLALSSFIKSIIKLGNDKWAQNSHICNHPDKFGCLSCVCLSQGLNPKSGNLAYLLQSVNESSDKL